MGGENLRSFVTGSQAYGTPTEDSDVDLMVWVTSSDLNRLRGMADKKKPTKDFTGEESQGSDGGPEADSLRFGKLNLIAVTWKEAFLAWQRGTEELIARRNGGERSISRDEAIELFRELRKKLTKGKE